MSKKSGEFSLKNVLRALDHPIRRRVLHALVDGQGSATTISSRLKLSLGTVSYHLNQVLAEECGLVDLVDTVQRRGAVEKFYRLKFDPSKDAPDPLPLSLEECFIAAVMAADDER